MKLGIVGCGGVARYVALFARLNRSIRLAACCDVSDERAGAFAARFRIPKAFSSLQEMLSETDLDAVYIAVPHHVHFAAAAAVLRAGRHVLLEKPIARTLAEGEALVELAREAGCRLGVNYQYRYDSRGYALARAVQGGALGEVLYGRVNVPWRRDESYFEAARWHGVLSESGGGTLITHASHFLDLALWACGSAPVRVTGVTAQRRFAAVEVEDVAMATVELANGALLQIASSMVARPQQPASVEIYAEKGTAIYADWPLPRLRFKGVRVAAERPPKRGVHALQRSLEGFRVWVTAGEPYLVPGEEALPALAAVEAIYRSAWSGRAECLGAERPAAPVAPQNP